ncbi:PEP-CTERM sorting domain-containing protein [Verrucomicrobiaceae bacterium R5-34]|uniref:PEP-CTERM sorting domain-containing protein n=1 Tax=Oceaniferula flava TaxID=2800421 RepID=A0AAE2VBA7_9BACT|nr:PEP-CTERM sorting domain-containing protein [Oceaniferula flavus]MBK1829299.1 PEP-CTERM sorting domain-containing protein [Verrucomicrobiaceae bacterium R5-34]MBK1853526.1 PEP-CTERM sorting domain-containing protein [Oceaniferula flavus]MBM1134831.1 PEP-CTERM sorting domain-containing protein [Oceaniferula flavus]
MKKIALLSLMSLPLSAATVSWDGGGADSLWETADNWSDDAVPSSGNDYVVDANTVRTADVSTNTFAGDSLTVQNGAVLNLYRTNGGGYFTVSHTINSLTVSDAELRPESSVGSIGHILTNSVHFTGSNTINMNYNSGYTTLMFLDGGLTGSGTIAITRDSTGSTRSLSIGGDASGYDGDITFSNVENTEVLTLSLDHSSGWGTGGVIIGDYGTLSFNTDVTNTAGLVSMGTTGTTLDLLDGTSSTVGALSIGGNAVNPGVYDAASLGALGYGGSFTGAGSLTVVPEPSSSALLALGGVAFFLRRRR